MSNTLILTLRIIGLLAAIVVLSVSGHLPLLAFVLALLAAFSVHVAADLTGDNFFKGEPLGVAITRWAGYAAAWGFGSTAFYANLPLKFYVLGFIGSITTHLIGDILVVKDSLNMGNFLSGLVLYPFIGWVGYGTTFFSILLGHGGTVSKVFGGLGLLLIGTGEYASYRIYTDGQQTSSHEPPAA